MKHLQILKFTEVLEPLNYEVNNRFWSAHNVTAAIVSELVIKLFNP